MDGRRAIWVSLPLLLWHFGVVMGCGKLMPFGNMTHDHDLEVGSNLTVQCHLFKDEIELNHTKYAVGAENLLLKFENSYLDAVRIVDNLTVEYFVPNATLNDSGLYKCYLDIPEMSANLLVCLSNIAVGYPPLDVTSFSCISDDFRNLTCSWEKPFNPVNTDYTLNDLLRGLILRKCPEVLNKTSCQYRKDTAPPYLLSPTKLHFRLDGNNSLGKNYQTIQVDHYKIVKPGMPRILPIFNATARSILLKWRPSKNLDYESFPPGLMYSVQYYPALYPGNIQEVILRFKENGSLLLEDLIPHTDYVFKVRCRSPYSEGEHMWSPTAIAPAGTLADVPYLAPEIASSSFDVETILGNRTITLYWRGVPPQFENGRDFHYTIEYHLYHVPSRVVREMSAINVGKNTFHSFSHLDAQSAYFFRISAVNEMGPSYNTSEIIVDKAEKLLEGPRDIVVLSHGNGTYEVSWKMSNRRPMNYTVFWCQSLKPRPVKCNGALSWLHTLKQQVELQLPDKSNYQFAVSANDERKSSGMYWASCIVALNVRYKLKRVELTPKNSTSLRIQWSLDCDAQRVIIEEYAIHYCEAQGTCCGNPNVEACPDWKTVHVNDTSVEEYILGGLKPFTFYTAFVRAYTRTGWSENSNVAKEATMSAAPSDSPREVEVLDINHKKITISFRPPSTPNGHITKYVVHYDRSPSEEYRLEVPVQEGREVYRVSISKSVFYFSNYSIQVKACVGLACSRLSQPVYAFTGISYPGSVSAPRVEVMQSYLNISWDPPRSPNGPIDFYQVWKESNDSDRSEVFNVTDKNAHLRLDQECGEKDDQRVYFFRIRAANVDGRGSVLYGEYSAPTKTTLCPSDRAIGLVIGIAAGCALGLVVMIFVIYYLYNCVKKEVAMIKGINVQLPKGLESPIENPLSSYDKFKNGLQKNHDSGTPYDRAYERLCSFASEGKGTESLIPDMKDAKNPFVGGEDSQRLKGRCSSRNNSGDSNNSGKGHDSISSSNTTKTHVSIDSGTEVDSPPSPDGFFSESSSSNTTPRSYKPDLAVVMEGKGSMSRDSGLEKEGAVPKFAWYVKKKCDGRMPSYSKFAIVNPTMPSFMPYGDQSGGIKDSYSLSNSEPSMADFDMGNGTEPPVLQGIQPYSKFGLARSAGNGLNAFNQPIAINSNVGYSKFGIVYRALKCPEIDMDDNPARIFCPGGSKFMVESPKAMAALTCQSNPFPFGLTNFKPAAFENNPIWGASSLEKKQIPLKANHVLPVEMPGDAYSKFGIGAPFTNVDQPSSGYISFNDTLKNTAVTCESNRHFDNYSKIGVAEEPNKGEMVHDDQIDTSNRPMENGATTNAITMPQVSRPSQKSYVPFQSAMAMNHQNDQLWNGLDGKACNGALGSKEETDAEDSPSILQKIASDPRFLFNQTTSEHELKTVPEAAQANVGIIADTIGNHSIDPASLLDPDSADLLEVVNTTGDSSKSDETCSSGDSDETLPKILDTLIQPVAISECVNDLVQQDFAQSVQNDESGEDSLESLECDSQKLPDHPSFNDNHITHSRSSVPQKNSESHLSAINIPDVSEGGRKNSESHPSAINLKESEDGRTSVRNGKSKTNGYVPLSELTTFTSLQVETV
ncbi:uncharacterized protein LOC129223978 [Uloborus diversus]|uniref:uncharacterized protein LOC129223978 n=1 Tax=Uloborus diversus TaxID=327109 RepID=UPI0024091B5E|nr:uncharacterized protein LOC129223978 [Uloborus diversus]